MRLMLCAGLLLVPLAVSPAAFASKPANDVTSPQHRVAQSTGVAPARVLAHPKSVFLPTDDLTALGAVPEFFELKLEVGRHGQAEGIRMVASSDPMLNKPVLKAVRQFRWSPARLDHHNIPVPVNLTVLVND